MTEQAIIAQTDTPLAAPVAAPVPTIELLGEAGGGCCGGGSCGI